MLGCLDVHYLPRGARAACVVIEAFDAAWPLTSRLAAVPEVEPYQPGRFYLRELPCLTAVLHGLERVPEVLVIDGYVWLSSTCTPGLGAHLHEATGRPVIGVAKTEFAALRGSSLVAPVRRGRSARPLFVTTVAFDLEQAARGVQAMRGAHRIPDALRWADRLARGLPIHSNPRSANDTRRAPATTK
ncbi:MAG TPA: endonuclease V [Casimicrobiaceae bacterium]|nr:endonuclease V [Casimicrobiaceae bacterium]